MDCLDTVADLVGFQLNDLSILLTQPNDLSYAISPLRAILDCGNISFSAFSPLFFHY
jgi:hypothetical protein